ncbi:alcohol acetyltransferase [Microlunatus parietis]|uniref:Alcohol acetyltransferase n=1 Tax=Microlunatus parietis TaxID=682979 RepID=A0A7Y9LBJ5_9ACTN|nr:alcohol acetyltransferase [Microlunatus parietis]NYE73889.1 hypothetical protein [Microlunatus parietis]
MIGGRTWVGRRTWVRLDNASNIFLASRSDADPKVFRISAELDHDVDRELLQQALDTTYGKYPLYHAVLRRGVFWYYLQDSDLYPVVTADEQHTCAPIYQADRRNLLFRVVHHRRRICLEVFHALSDGTGALWFLSDLVNTYVRLRNPDLRNPDQSRPAETARPAGDSLPDPGRADYATGPVAGPAEPVHALIADSFAYYFGRRRHEEPVADRPVGEGPPPDGPQRSPWWRRRRVHRIRGTRTPDHRTRVVELTAPVPELLDLARSEGVSLTMYLTGVFFEAVRRSSGLDRPRTLAATVPVNLRQFFPSTSPRNFFATIRVEHRYGHGSDDLGSVCRELDRQFRLQAAPEALERKLRRFARFERMPVLRVVPRPLKDVILGLISRASNRGLTVAVSNLGRVTLPQPADGCVGRLLLHVSAVRPQVCVISHAGLLTMSFTSQYHETGHVREFARLLTGRGLTVTVAASRVTEEELAESEP